MQTKDFYFDLPENLIAQYPGDKGDTDRLLVLNRKTGKREHMSVNVLPQLLSPDTLMIFNNSRVRKARVYAQRINPELEKHTEFLFINPLPQYNQDCGIQSENIQTQLIQSHAYYWKVMVKNARRCKIGHQYKFSDGTYGQIIAPIDYQEGKDLGEFRIIQFEQAIDELWFEKNGHIPLPPYIKRDDTIEDSKRYQTVYAKESGSVAAPTAGLHFTDDLIKKIQAHGIDIAWVTLHVGLGTFLPVRSEKIEQHIMHNETYFVSQETVDKVAHAKSQGKPILAVGTTSVRTLESAWNQQSHSLNVGWGNTQIFIYPGYTFKVVDQLFTNFHTPESTLLMLVSAFAGKETIINTYQEAIKEQYRFFSYGDAMLIL